MRKHTEHLKCVYPLRCATASSFQVGIWHGSVMLRTKRMCTYLFLSTKSQMTFTSEYVCEIANVYVYLDGLREARKLMCDTFVEWKHPGLCMVAIK